MRQAWTCQRVTDVGISLQLSTGWSSLTTMELSVPETRIRVGSAPDCEWPIQASGVAPYHLEFYWDGQAAWVVPSGGPVNVGGQAVEAWHQIEGHAVVQFGQAAVQVGAGHMAGAGSASAMEVSDSMMVLDADDIIEPMAGEATRVLDPSGRAFGAFPPKQQAPVAFQKTMLPSSEPLAPAATAVAEPPRAAAPNVPAPVAPAPIAPAPTAIAPAPSSSAPSPGDLLPSGPTRVFDPDQGIVVGSRPTLEPAAPGFEPPPPARPQLSASNQATDVLPSVDGGREEAEKSKLPPTRTLVLFLVTALAGLLLILSTFFTDEPPTSQGAAGTAGQAQQADQEAGAPTSNVAQAGGIALDDDRIAARQAQERERQEREVRLTQEAQSRAQTLRDGFVEELFDDREELEDEEQDQLTGRVEVELALEAARAFAGRDNSRALGIYLYLRDNYNNSDYAAFVEIVRERELCQDC